MAPSLEEPIFQPADDALNSKLKQQPALIAPEPSNCVGPQSEEAGKADACAGCPNQGQYQ